MELAIPVLILVALSIGAQQVVQPLALNEQIERLEQNQDLSEEQKEAMLDRLESMMGTSGSLKSYLLTTVATLARLAVMAAVVMFFGSFILAGEATFRLALAIVVFVSLISVLELAVKVPLMLQSGSIQVETGLSLLLPVSLKGTLLYRFFLGLDLFAMWKVALIATGTATVFKVKEKTALQVFFAGWVVQVFLLAWLLGGFMGA